MVPKVSQKQDSAFAAAALRGMIVDGLQNFQSCVQCCWRAVQVGKDDPLLDLSMIGNVLEVSSIGGIANGITRVSLELQDGLIQVNNGGRRRDCCG